MTTRRVAIIGLGYFSQFHLQSWGKLPEVEVAAATDLDPGRRAWAETEFGVPCVESVAALLDLEPDIIDIVAPPPAHAALVTECLAAGRTLICQKPFCTSYAEAHATAQAAHDAGTRVLIHENFRFQPWYRTIKSILDNGRMGQVYGARFALRPGDGRGPEAYLDRQPAFQTMERLLVHETGVHFLDLFRWLFGEIDEIYADLRQLNPALKGEDAGVVMMDHASGARSVFDGNRLADHATDAPRRTMGEFVIEGEGGTLSLDGTGCVRWRAFGAQDWQEEPLAYPPDDSFGGGCVHALNQHVVAALNGDGAFENEVQDYLPIIALSDLAYASHAQRRKLKV